ncbi:MAG: metallophosphoesterase [Treponema sp.]|nr:metallophosphoesterase [Treponema sp.]
MVKKHLWLLFAVLISFWFINSCSNDFLGLFVSSDLDERLKEKNNFRFLINNDIGRDWTNLTLGNSYSFIVLADTHIQNRNAFGLERLGDVIAANPEIKFVVILGDITQYGAAQDIDRFIEIADSFGIPVFPVIGNHDFYFGNWPVWRDRIGSTVYRVNADSATLFVLDSGNSFFGREQLNWLERELQTTAGRVFVFAHHSLFVRGPLGMQQVTDTRERARLVSILRGRSDIMFMGHSHSRLIHEVGNVKYVTIEDFFNTNIYCLVIVTPDGIELVFEKL